MDSIWDDADIVYRYSRKQAMLDGVLVDCTNSDFGTIARRLGIRVNVAMTCGVWAAAIGGLDEPIPAGQTVESRIRDVLYAFRMAVAVRGSETDRVHFKVAVLNLDQTRETISLWALIGPGDEGEAVITIMLEGED